MSELLPCPFCSTGRLGIEHKEWNDGTDLFTVHCSCGSEGPTHCTSDGAVAAWNRRAQQAQPAPSAEAMYTPGGGPPGDPNGEKAAASGAEPVAWGKAPKFVELERDYETSGGYGLRKELALKAGYEPLYTSPVVRQPLTREQRDEMIIRCKAPWHSHAVDPDYLISAVEAFHGIPAPQAGKEE